MDSFFKRGSIKIGTLYEYRNEEELGNVVGDDLEGVHITELHSPEGRKINLVDNSPESNYFRKHILRPDQQASNVKIIMEAGASLIAHTNSPDSYIYCLTSNYDEKVMKEFECDRCIEIFDPQKFFKAISKVIRHKGTFDGVHEISYGSKTTDHLNPHEIYPALLKAQKYANQSEIRAIWTPKKKLRGSLFVNVPKAVKYCREYRP